MADNINDPNPPQPQPEDANPGNNNKLNAGMRIVGFNLLALAGYTILCAVSRDAGIIIDAILLLVHVATCIFLALAYRKWVWVLSGLMVLIIGFSTCVGLLPGLDLK